MPAQTAKKTSPLKGNEAVVSKKHPGYEVVEPVRQPKDIVSYRESGPGVTDPIENAEMNLQFIEGEFEGWIAEDCAKMREYWLDLKSEPENVDKFIAFHKAVHTISGNAAILNCPWASAIAQPLARMLERRPKVEDHIPMIDSAVMAICAVTCSKENDEDQRVDEIIAGLNTIVERWIARRT